MLENVKIVSIIREVEVKNALKIMEALSEEGITYFEVSLSKVEMGLECIQAAQEYFVGTDVKVGAGTVSKKTEVDKLKGWGTPYILTPGFDEELVEYALEKKMEVLPGVLTPSDVQKAANRGLKLLKLFPADAFGRKYVKALKGPFPDINYVAVGGVTSQNVAEFFENGYAGIAAGSNLVPKQASEKDIKTIRESARRYMAACRAK
ncbi:MAG: bifunctional 4-hydroxy-2-oxoglutarate aldolase/2-dehydro-3-deoxy-phosphogluconate aldolase [Hespellia sp.]|nr:bifunctional 4-hydroxy-2-oxoglutarate aldolase/2-dehydro-3-deoxy-phosphogluconate aldolase [Hespellia sp.]